MAQSDPKEKTGAKSGDVTSIGVNDDTWKSMPRDEARALLCIFATQEVESRAMGTTMLLSPPNGKDLYVTPRMTRRPGY